MTPHQNQPDKKAVRSVLEKFQAAYTARDLSKIDQFMTLLDAQDPEIELIGIGAFERGGQEWFIGQEAIREIIQSDWKYWGDVNLDVNGAQIHVLGDTAWLTTTGSITQTTTHDKALPFYLEQMKELLENDQADNDAKLLEATHFGMRRLRERLKGMGHQWPFVFSAILVRRDGSWKFHTIHWSMPVD